MATTRAHLINTQSIQEAADNNESPEQNDAFWFHPDIDINRWDQKFPYQFLVVEYEDGHYREVAGWNFTLPIPPESLSISMPFAISTAVTLGGIIEEHNGAPLRMIQFSGTTGVMPLRGAANQLDGNGFLGSIFAGTIQAAQGVANSALNVAKAFTGISTTNVIPSTLGEFDPTTNSIARSSGYFQFRLMNEFLENYAAVKKKAEGEAYRLAFCMWKDQSVYLVQPVSFDMRRSAGSPFEYTYSMSLKAWRRIELDKKVRAVDNVTVSVRRPGAIKQMLNALEAARNVLQDSRATILAIGGDLQSTVFQIIRQTALFLKDALGVPLACTDLSTSTVKNAQGAIMEWVSAIDAAGNIGRIYENASEETRQAASDLATYVSNVGKAETKAGNPATESSRFGLSNNPASDLFEYPDDHYDFFNVVKPNDLKLSPEVIKQISAERQAARVTTRAEFEEMRDEIVTFAGDFANHVGAGHDTYDETYYREITDTKKEPTDDDFQVLFALNNVLMVLDKLSASGHTDRLRIDTLEQIAGMVRQSGIAFKVPTSKYAIPFPYGSTLEQIAAKYLGDPMRWIEISALNGLRTPYIDEEGSEQLLLTNGKDNQVAVSDSTNLYIGQMVTLSSTSTSRTKRRIVNIDRLSPSLTILTLDGEPDLEAFSTLARATLHSFLPDTINSQQLLYIPSESEPNGLDNLTKAIPGIDEFDPLIKAGGVDLLLTQDGDIITTQDGDQKLAFGLTNLVQTAVLAITTPKDSLIFHPGYGLGLNPGVSTADLTPQEAVQAIRAALESDSDMLLVKQVQVSKQGPVMSSTIAIQAVGTTHLIPITVDIKR